MERWNMAKKTERVATNVTPEKKEQIENELDYGDHISDWLREAIDEKLARDDGDQGNPKVAMPAD